MTIVLALIVSGSLCHSYAAAADTVQSSEGNAGEAAQGVAADATDESGESDAKNGAKGSDSGAGTDTDSAGAGKDTAGTGATGSGTGAAGTETDTKAPSGSDAPPDTEDETGGLPVLQNLLMTDDENIYDGMDRAYRDGYAPSVGSGLATVVLPLYTDAAIDIPSIRVIPDLGATTGSPFVFKNYQKTILKTDEKINGTDEVRRVYLVKFGFELQDGYQNGVYPVILNIDYTYEGVSMTQSFTTYIQITDGKSTEPETQPPAAVEEPEDPTSEPKVIIEKCTGMPEKIESGDTFSFTAVLKNTNKLKSVQNMTVTVTCEAEGISLQSDSNVFYFDSLASLAALELPLTFKTDEKAGDGKYTITLSMAYDNPDAVSLSSSGNIEIALRQKLDVALEVGAMTTEVNAGDSMTLPVQAMNLGRGKIYNARCQINVPGLSAEKSLFLGNMEGGSAASGELSLFAGMVNPQAEEDQGRYGKTIGTVELIYEDEAGNEYTAEEEISITINPLKINASLSPQDNEEDGIGNQLLIGIGALALVVAAGTLIPALIRKRRRRAGYGED